MKIIITETQVRNIINEYIHPSEGMGYGAVQTLFDNKRGVAFFATSGLSNNAINHLADKLDVHNIKSIRVPYNKNDAYIFFKEGYEERAKRLLQIAIKYGGYLSLDATEEETREIGEILEYEPEEIEKFIKNGNRI